MPPTLWLRLRVNGPNGTDMEVTDVVTFTHTERGVRVTSPDNTDRTFENATVVAGGIDEEAV